MGTEVLRPQDCLFERIRVPSATVFNRRRNYGNNYQYNSYHAKPIRSKFDHKRKASDSSSTISRRYNSEDLKQPKNSPNLMVPDQIRSRSRSLSPKPVGGGLPDMYAGSAFSVSPSPESLPLPSFSKKKQASVSVDDSATRDLRRLLRLD